MPALGNDEKRKFIVNEIEAWRRSKLLPEHYCDFLQNLYLDDLTDRPKGAVEKVVRSIEHASRKKWILYIGIFALICLVTLHFSVFPLPLQIAVVGLVTTGFVALGGMWREPHPIRALFAMGGGMLFLFGTGAVILRLHGWDDGAGPIVLLGVCAALCIVCGLLLRLPLIHWMGWLSLVALYAKLLIRHIPEPSWAQTQIFWIPAALLFLWLAWFLHVRFRSVGAVLFGTGLIVWYMPELQGVLGGVPAEWVQAGFLGKTIMMGLGLFRLRKQWTEWVVK